MIRFYGTLNSLKQWHKEIANMFPEKTLSEITAEDELRNFFEVDLSDDEREDVQGQLWYITAPGERNPWNWRIGYSVV